MPRVTVTGIVASASSACDSSSRTCTREPSATGLRSARSVASAGGTGSSSSYTITYNGFGSSATSGSGMLFSLTR